jgi:FAD:protein FMN transferase
MKPPAAVVCLVAALMSADAPLVSREVYLMGTRATLSTRDSDRGRGLRRLERLLEPLESAEAQLSTWRPDSEVSRINAAGGVPLTVSPSLCASLRVIARWVGETDRAFDPAIGALIAAWDLHGSGRAAGDREIAAALTSSGWDHVVFDSDRCRLALEQGATVDVGAWGKGDALDRAREAVEDERAPWLIDLGGQVAGDSAGGAAWRVDIAHPLIRSAPAAHVVLERGSLATSGGSERDRHVNGARIGHLLDPRTGYPASFRGSVTVWHEQALVADILSTALYVMGPDEGIRWSDARGIAACFLIGAKAARPRCRTTAAFRTRFGTRAGTAYFLGSFRSPQVAIDFP